MAWPCISRVCCLARFWNQLDKSDLSVPLTIHNYSDIEEPSEDAGEAAAEQHRQQQQQRIPTGGGGGGSSRAPPALPASASAPSLQDPGQPHSRKGGRRHLQPFSAETQYRQDYRAWPLQKRHVLPWIRHGTADGSAPRTAHVYVLPADGHGQGQVGGREGALPQSQEWASRSPPGLPRTSSYRHEYRPWTAAKRSRPTKTKQGFIIPEDHFGQESSYKADFKIPEAKAKFSPNPSAVFQAPTRILNV